MRLIVLIRGGLVVSLSRLRDTPTLTRVAYLLNVH